MKIKLSTILPIEDRESYKVHIAITDESHDPSKGFKGWIDEGIHKIASARKRDELNKETGWYAWQTYASRLHEGSFNKFKGRFGDREKVMMFSRVDQGEWKDYWYFAGVYNVKLNEPEDFEYKNDKEQYIEAEEARGLYESGTDVKIYPYDSELDNFGREFIGRLIVHYKNTGQNTTRNMEELYDDITVYSIIPEGENIFEY